MTPTSQLGSALRYRYKSLTAAFLLITCASCWLFATHAAHATPAAHPQAPAVLSQTTPGIAPQPIPLTLPAPPATPIARPVVAIRNPAQIKQLQTALWSAIDRTKAIESRLAELAIPTAPVIRQPAPIASVSPELRTATTRVATAKSRLAELQTRYTDAYPDVVQARDDLQDAEQVLYMARRTAASTPAPARPHLIAPATPSPQVEAERATLRTELEQLAPTIPDLQSQLDAATSLPRHQPPHPSTYWPLVLPHTPSPPTAPPLPTPVPLAPSTTPASPTLHFARYLPQSMLLGFLAAAIVFSLLESLDRTIKGPESLRHALPADARQITLRSMRA